jgi:ABC-type Fe3+ transport system substrate-binding protein
VPDVDASGFRNEPIRQAGLAALNANPKYRKLFGQVFKEVRQGAPIDFVPVQPVVARPQGIGLAKNAPHPHAALLFTDYVLSPAGQKLFESLAACPSSRVKRSQ